MSETDETRVSRYIKALDAISNPALRDRLARAVIAVTDEQQAARLRQAEGRLAAIERLAAPLRCIPGEDRDVRTCEVHHDYWWPESQHWCNDMDPDVAALLEALDD